MRLIVVCGVIFPLATKCTFTSENKGQCHAVSHKNVTHEKKTKQQKQQKTTFLASILEARGCVKFIFFLLICLVDETVQTQTKLKKWVKKIKKKIFNNQVKLRGERGSRR